MTCTLILTDDIAEARIRAKEIALEASASECAWIWVPQLEGEGDSARPRLSDAPEIEDFDVHSEPLILGSRLAQQCSWVDLVVVEGLEAWAENLHRRYPGLDDKIESERISLVSVVDNAMADLVILSRPTSSGQGTELLARTIEALRVKADSVMEF